MTSFVGQQFGNYALTRLLGEGNFARVYLGEHIYLKTQAAIKILNGRLDDDLEFFRTEARTIARLVHPNIVRVLEFGVEGDVPFLVLDYAPNGTLRQRYPSGTLLAFPTVVSYATQVAAALQYAHDARVIHRDIKPENLLLGRENDVLLSDFGVALMSLTLRSLRQQDIAGTPAYMAPEQIQQRPGPASDQYALAIVVYEWLTGVLPFYGSFTEILARHISTPPPAMRAIRPAISSAIEQVIMKALQKDPAQRYESVQAFARALEQASQAGGQALAPTLVASVPASSSPAAPTVLSDSAAAAPVRFSSMPSLQTPASSQSPATLLSTYRGHSRPVGSLCWLADGQRILSTSNDTLIHVWNALSGSQVRCYQEASTTVRSAAGSWDGTQLATVGEDALVRVRDLASNRLLTTYGGHGGQSINALAWAPTQPLLATAAADGTVHVWDSVTGQTLAIYRGHTGNVNSLA